jgi:hypothetical protein
LAKAGFAELNVEEQKQVQDLKTRDREVRAHEQAHVAAGGRYVQGGASYDFQTGPDGRRYAVGGEVSIDASPVPGNPSATIQKAQTIKRAALAPAKPSAQDRAVAAKATNMEAEARTELREEKQEQAERAGEQKKNQAHPYADLGGRNDRTNAGRMEPGSYAAGSLTPARLTVDKFV